MRYLILANSDIGLFQFRKELIFELLNNNEVYIALPYGELVDPLIKAGCNFIETPLDRRGLNPFKDLSLFCKYLSILKSIHPDFVITYTIKPNIYGGYASRLKRIPYAANITGLGTVFEKDNLLKSAVTKMYKASLKTARIVFFENTMNRDLFTGKNIVSPDKTCVLNGAGVNLCHFSIQDYPSNSIFRFLFVGRVMKEKGIDELLLAMKMLSNNGEKCILDVVGPFEENYRDQLKQYEQEGWLKYHGYQKDVRPFYKECDCFVLPSYHEGMANTNLEAAACGRPIITSNIPGCKEAVVSGISGFLCEPQNANSLFEVMNKMMSLSSIQRKNMGAFGRQHVENTFDKEKVVQATIRHLM